MPSDDRKAPPGTGDGRGPDRGPENDLEAATEAAIDALYQGPLSEFVGERNRLARELRGRDRAAAERVRALAKPSLSAWAVNQAYWHARPAFEAMLDAGEAMRALQQRVMRGEAIEGLAAASSRLNEAMTPVMRAAQEALERDDHSASVQHMRRVTTTLKAIAAHGRADTAPPAGRLSADISAPGFDLLTALAPAQGAPRRAPRPADAAPGAGDGAQGESRRESRRESGREARPESRGEAQTAAKTTARPDARPRATPHRAAQAPRSRQEAQARHAARARAGEAKAALVARQRALATAERAERAAAERLDAAGSAVTAARAALDRATMAHDRAAQAHARAEAEADEARAALAAAREELESAENQVRALVRDRGPGDSDPA